MRYLSGIYALNVPSSDGTPGDWHNSGIDWSHPLYLDTKESIFGDFGVRPTFIPGLGVTPTASHIRACLDLLASGNYGTPQGMRQDFIANESLTPIIFNLVLMMRSLPNWQEIESFMLREYGRTWAAFSNKATGILG